MNFTRARRGEISAESYWNEVAELWRAIESPPTHRVDRLADLLGCGLGSHILDAGCGTGRWSVVLAQRGYKIWGIDLSRNMALGACDRARVLGIGHERARYRAGNLESLPYPTSSMDVSICFDVIDFVMDPLTAIRELGRVLKPSGRLILSTLGACSPVKRNDWRRFLTNESQHLHLPLTNGILPWEVQAILREVGWQVIFQGPHFDNEHNTTISECLLCRKSTAQELILQQTLAESWLVVATRPNSVNPK